MQVEGVCCKVGVQEGSLCMCAKSELECIVPTTCIKMTEQFFCLDCRCAFPCDPEVPCMGALIGLQCVKAYQPAFGCCKSLAAEVGVEDDD